MVARRCAAGSWRVLPQSCWASPALALALVLAGSAVFGALAGAVFGWAQYLALRAHARHARRWITANAAGWALGLPWSYLAGSLANVSARPAWAVPCAVLAGALMGLSVALATARALARLEPLGSSEASTQPLASPTRAAQPSAAPPSTNQVALTR